MHTRRQCLAMAVLLCAAACRDAPPGASRAATDACELPPLGTSMHACLLPSSDARHDPSKRVAPDVDCFWQTKAPLDKQLRADATGVLMTYLFTVENKCSATDVDVEFASAPGSLSSWYCPYDRVPVPRASTNTLVCYASHSRGALTLTRTYGLRVVSVNESIVAPVELDPEIVLEKAGGGRSIPDFAPRSSQ